MVREGFDCLVAGGGPSHWSAGYGMGWLTGHTREWHSVAAYLVFPLRGEPTLVYSMGGTHIEAVRRSVVVKDVRSSKQGRFGEVIAARIKELGLAEGRVGITDLDSRFNEGMPVNHYNALREQLPRARLDFVQGLFHELWAVKSDEEVEALERAAEICDSAMQAVADRARPGVKEYELRAAAANAILERNADFNFIIIGSTPTADPRMVFGNPRPSGRSLKRGDLILDEIAVEYKGFQAQLGTPICIGEPDPEVLSFFNDVVLPGFKKIENVLRPGNTLEDVRRAARFFREKGYQSRPIILHGLGVSSEGPEVYVDKVEAEPYESVLKPNMTLMLEPNPISPDGNLGIFLGHSYVITENGNRRLTKYPLELTIAGK
jgi:Xaa-Pro aminopeptidase